MTAKEMLLDCLAYYKLEVIKVEENTISTVKEYTIEIETNGMYKLISKGLIVGPFSDLDELCAFIKTY